MYIHEYGSEEKPTIILLAPMLISGEELYKLASPHFAGQYHIIAPDQGGHGRAGAYIGADEEYGELKRFLLERGFRQISLLYGASLGGAVAYRLFLDSDFEVARLWFDSVMLSSNAPFLEWFTRNLFRKYKKRLARKNYKVSDILIKMYGYDFARMMTKNFERITPNDIDAICYACSHYDLRELTDAEQKKMHFDFGDRDFDLKYSRKTISAYMPEAELTIRKGYIHCGYMAAHPQEYVEQIEAFIGNNEERRIYNSSYSHIPD